MTEATKTAEAPAKKAAPAKKPPAGAAPPRAATATMLRGLIFKSTGHKPVAASFTTWPNVPSGSFVINMLIGGSRTKDGKGLTCPGFPRRRISEVYGPEASGKTTVALQAIVQVQKAGGLAMFLDFEHALAHGYAKAIGVSFDEDKLLYYAPNTLEEGFKMIYLAIRAGVDLIVVDSVAAMVPKDELEKKIDDPVRVGLLAAPMSRNLPKVAIWLDQYPADKAGKKLPNHQGTALLLVNQIRAKIDRSHDPENTPGGAALKFYASIRLRFSKIKAESIKKKDPMTNAERTYPYGNVTQVKVIKNKMDLKQGQTGEIFIRFGVGIDEYYSVIEAGVARRVVKKDGAYYEFGTHRYQGRDKFRNFLMSDAAVFKDLSEKVSAAMLAAATQVEPDEDEEEPDMLADMRREGLLGDGDLPEGITDEEVAAIQGATPDEDEGEIESAPASDE